MGDHRLRDLWLSEMWRPVKEYHPPIDPRSIGVDKPEETRRGKRGEKAE